MSYSIFLQQLIQISFSGISQSQLSSAMNLFRHLVGLLGWVIGTTGPLHTLDNATQKQT
jgi:hypothetical protein